MSFTEVWVPTEPPPPGPPKYVVLGPREVTVQSRESHWRNPHARNSLKRYDALGRPEMSKVTMPWLMLSLRELFAQHTRPVPSHAIEEILDEESGSSALVRCPCGQQPIATEGATNCVGCERWYILVGRHVFVIYGEMHPPKVGR